MRQFNSIECVCVVKCKFNYPSQHDPATSRTNLSANTSCEPAKLYTSSCAEEWRMKKMERILCDAGTFIKVYYCWESFWIFSVAIFIQRTYMTMKYGTCDWIDNNSSGSSKIHVRCMENLMKLLCVCYSVIPGKCYASQEVHQKFGLFKWNIMREPSKNYRVWRQTTTRCRILYFD